MASNWLQVLLRIPIICALDYCCSFLYDDLTSIWPWYFALTIQVLCKFKVTQMLILTKQEMSYHLINK